MKEIRWLAVSPLFVALGFLIPALIIYILTNELWIIFIGCGTAFICCCLTLIFVYLFRDELKNHEGEKE